MALDFSVFGYALSISWDTVSSSAYTIVLLLSVYLLKRILNRGIRSQAKKRRVPSYHYKPLLQVLNLFLFTTACILLIGIWGMQDLFYGLLAGAGFAGIVVGMAARDVIGNFLAGITLFFDRPFKIGDNVEIAGVAGKVKDVSIRSTRLITPDGLKVVLPNSEVVGSKIVNYSYYTRCRRTLTVKVPVTADLKKAYSVINKTLEKDEKSADRRVFISAVGNNYAEFSVQYWVNRKEADLPEQETRMLTGIVQSLRKSKVLPPG